MTSVAILTYHPIHIVENSYAGNDLLALQADLATIEKMGIEVRSLDQIFTPPESTTLLNPNLSGPVVAITFDDGSIFDFVDRDHPTCGPQDSAASILHRSKSSNRTLRGARPCASTFVIASPSARDELDRKDYFGGGYWPDNWWASAVAGEILGVESHSWDHNHPSLAMSVQRDNVRGTFCNIETVGEAEAEIDQSISYISRQAGIGPKFFAYPWGEANDFLSKEYLPKRGRQLGLRAAFTGGGSCSGFVTEASNRWFVPRFICQCDWKSTADLEELLEALSSMAA